MGGRANHLQDTQHTQAAEKVDIMRIEDLIGEGKAGERSTIQAAGDITGDWLILLLTLTLN